MSLRAVVWLRRDLRLTDNAALAHACAAADGVALAFVLGPKLLRGGRFGAPIVQVFFESLAALRAELRALGSDLAVLEGDAAEEIPRFARRIGAGAVYFNDDYEPAARERDARVVRALGDAGIKAHASLDHVYYGAGEITRDDGKPYSVFTPYQRRWHARREADPRLPYASSRAARSRVLPGDVLGSSLDVPRPEDYGHASSERYPRGGADVAKQLLAAFVRDHIGEYETARNIPSCEGTSRLSPHLRAGTIGIRTCVAAAMKAGGTIGPATWLTELIWRDFYQQILAIHPRVADGPYIEAAAKIPWIDDEADLRAWEAGQTGYPIVDAAMRQLNETGWMHNRVRMVVASFLSKHLLIDWRHGERYFERRLADADLAANNGGWQWSSSTGTDPVPYFRIFNPVLQAKRFDADGAFVRRFVPELARVPDAYIHTPWTMPPLIAQTCGVEIGRDYPLPIVDHAFARDRALAAYKGALGRA